MRRSVQAGLLAALIVGPGVGTAPVLAQAVAQPAPAAGDAARPQATRPQTVPGAGEVLATVNEDNLAEKVTKGDLVNFLSRYPIPANESREQVYRDAIDSLVNTKLLTLFLTRQKIAVPPGKVEEELERLKSQLKTEGQDLATALLENNIAIDDVKKEMQDRIRWREYVTAKATDAELRRYFAANRDLFHNTQVRASHILLRVDADTPAAGKEKAKQKLQGIKAQLDANKMTFAEAANKYSEDPANSGGAGGDLDYFTLSSGFISEFTDAAFKLKKGMISDVVETPYGYHLIQVTDRKEGRPVDFEQSKPYVLQVYAGELQKNLLTEERKRAKIDLKPMPKDLFPNAPAAAPATKGAAPATKPGS